MTKKHFAEAAPQRINKLEGYMCPDELRIHGSLERQKTNRMRKPTLPKIVLSELNGCWAHGVRAVDIAIQDK